MGIDDDDDKMLMTTKNDDDDDDDDDGDDDDDDYDDVDDEDEDADDDPDASTLSAVVDASAAAFAATCAVDDVDADVVVVGIDDAVGPEAVAAVACVADFVASVTCTSAAAYDVAAPVDATDDVVVAFVVGAATATVVSVVDVVAAATPP